MRIEDNETSFTGLARKRKVISSSSLWSCRILTLHYYFLLLCILFSYRNLTSYFSLTFPSPSLSGKRWNDFRPLSVVESLVNYLSAFKRENTIADNGEPNKCLTTGSPAATVEHLQPSLSKDRGRWAVEDSFPEAPSRSQERKTKDLFIKDNSSRKICCGRKSVLAYMLEDYKEKEKRKEI